MPVPWSAQAFRIRDQARRGITIHQLRDLRTFLQRLCKADLLESREKGRIDWFSIDLYDIADLVIRPLIMYMEDEVRRTKGRFSWVEFVANREQFAEIHIVHSWHGRFRDFMAVVDSLARDERLGWGHALWVCPFANSVFGEDFGKGLRSSPVQLSIDAVPRGAALFLDREGLSLTRVWCGLELFTVQEQNKDLVIYTPSGRVGKDVKTGPLVEALQVYDITLCEATEESDRRQILNFIGGGEARENDGLKKNRNGSLKLVDGYRKHIDSVERVTNGRRRQNGEREYVHEAKLIEEHHQEYKQFNQQIRNYVKTGLTSYDSFPVQDNKNLPQPQDRGITLGQWKTFGKKVRNWASTKQRPFEKLTVDDVAKDYVMSVTAPGRSYCELFGTPGLRPQYMIDEPRNGNFSDLLSTLEWFSEAMRLRDDTVFWCQIVCIRQHDAAIEFNGWLDTTLPAVLKDCSGLFSFLPSEKHLIVRCNRMFAWQLCFENAKELYLGCTSGVLSCNSSFAEGGFVFGVFDLNIARIIIDANWKQAETADPKIGPMVASRIKRSRGGFGAFTGRLCRVVVGPLLRNAARAGGPDAVHEIQALCRHEAIMLNSGSLTGCLRETAVHVAAANGNVDVLKALLDLQADPNSEDHIRETPLHYAAITGQASSVKILLRYGARPRAESAFAETPLHVAEQNMAAFMGIDTKKVVELLYSWECINDGDLDYDLSESEEAKNKDPDSPEPIIGRTRSGFPRISKSKVREGDPGYREPEIVANVEDTDGQTCRCILS